MIFMIYEMHVPSIANSVHWLIALLSVTQWPRQRRQGQSSPSGPQPRWSDKAPEVGMAPN